MSKIKIIAVASHGPALAAAQTTTTTMKNTPTTKSKPTAGPWSMGNTIAVNTMDRPYDKFDVYAADGTHICEKTIISTKRDAHKANMNLIVEAGTVYHETGLTPRELVERIKQLKEALKEVLESQGQSIEERLKVYDKAQAKLKATE